MTRREGEPMDEKAGIIGTIIGLSVLGATGSIALAVIALIVGGLVGSFLWGLIVGE